MRDIEAARLQERIRALEQENEHLRAQLAQSEYLRRQLEKRDERVY